MTAYSEAAEAVAKIYRDHPHMEATVICYMVARSALLSIRSAQGSARAAEIAYALADEFAGEVTK